MVQKKLYKLRDITSWIRGMVLLISLFTLMVNVVFVPQIKSFTRVNEAVMQQLQKGIFEMEMSLKVIDNLSGIIDREGEGALTKAQQEAFSRNRALIGEEVEHVSLALTTLAENLDALDLWSAGQHQQLVDGMRQTSGEILLLLKQYESNDTDSTFLKTVNVALDARYNELVQQNQQINENVLSDISWLINGMFIVLLMILLIFETGIDSFVRKDLNFIVKSFEQIESHRYDAADLPALKPRFQEQKVVLDTVRDIMEERQFTMQISQLLMKHYVIDDVVRELFGLIQDQMAIDRVGIAFVDYNRQKIIAEFGVARYDHILLGPGFEVGIDQTTLARIIASHESMITADVQSEIKKRPKSPALNLLIQEGVRSNLVVPLTMGGAVFGMFFFSSVKANHFKSEDQRLAEKIIREISGMLNRAYFTKVILSRITNSFSELVDRKDNDTGEHIERMVRYAVVIANGVRGRNHPDYPITTRDILEIERNASAHDIGKVGIPDDILKKPGKLTPEEWAIMQTHVEIGAGIFADMRNELSIFDSDFFKTAEEITRFHHEKWDGTGYPMGIKGHEIPLSARIVAVSDVFDAVSSKRVYKKAFAFEESVEIIRQGSGNHFDPFIVEVFLEVLPEIREIYGM